MNHPHFDIFGITHPHSSADGGVGALLSRAADCLTALLHGPTTTAGLNESRYNVLDALRRMPAGTCTQTELAARLLLSESNLSTLLERMRQDDLISRVRSETDRRKSLIGLTAAGREAQARADLARSRATATVLQELNEPQRAALCASLELLLQRLERELGVAARNPTQVANPAAAMTSERRPSRATSLISNGHKP